MTILVMQWCIIGLGIGNIICAISTIKNKKRIKILEDKNFYAYSRKFFAKCINEHAQPSSTCFPEDIARNVFKCMIINDEISIEDADKYFELWYGKKRINE